MHISRGLQPKPTPKLATAKSLERMDRVSRQLAGTGSLSRLERRWLAFCVVLIRMGFDGIYAPIDALTRACFRIQGETNSDSSTFRGLKGLEQKGYLRRQRFRVGADRFNVKIFFNLDAFSYWTRQTQSHVAPAPEPEPQVINVSYTDLQLSKCEQDKVASEDPCSNSGASHCINSNMPARAKRLEPVKKTGKRARENPIFYSLRIVTRGKGKALRRVLLALAHLEITRPELRQSGADWSKWLAKNKAGKPAWLELSIPEREAVALEQILPCLEAYLSGPAPPDRDVARLVTQTTRKTRPAPAPTAKTIQGLLMGSPIGQALKTACADSGQIPKKPALEPDDLAILAEARAKAKAEADYP